MLAVIVSLQAAYFILGGNLLGKSEIRLPVDSVLQAQLEARKQRRSQKDTVPIYPFNPNFISDFKGYTLGMNVTELDKLHAFRATGKFISSKDEFQKITGISDSLLNTISPYFKFPNWSYAHKGSGQAKEGSGIATVAMTKKKVVYKDLNSATAKELTAIRGVGPKLSARIVKFRDALNGFLVKEQLYDVYGLEPQVVHRLFEEFDVLKIPAIQKININTATASELASLLYLNYDLANKIVAYRAVVGTIESFDELITIENFPADKIDRIALYLSL